MQVFWRRNSSGGLGSGVWRRAHDRFLRAVDRYHQMLESCGEGPARQVLQVAGLRLAAALDDVRAVCLDGQSRWPSEGLDIPPASDVVHRALSQAASGAAQAAEAAAMTRVAARAGAEAAATAAARAEAAARAVDGVHTKVDEARKAVQSV